MPAVGAVRQVALSAGRDLDATLAFWREVLGTTVHARFDPPGIAFIMAGDVRLLFTDGIAEASASDGQEFGEDCIANFMSANRENSAAALNEGLMARVSEYCDAQFQDDATLVVIAVY